MQISEGEPAGLRERKRQRTRETIARVALELFDRQGFQETTIPQIAEAADVSPRTVSAYFPHKEDLAFPDVDAEFDALEARMRDRPAEETAVAALRAWIGSWLEDGDVSAIQRQTRHRVIRADDDLRAYEHRFTLRARQVIAAAIARDLGVPPGDLEPRMAAAATLTVFEVLGEDHETAEPAEALAVVDRALLFIDGGISALR
ncbi:MAG: TetR family transcriptional regulator [Solirubrobacteraceae bacterium]